MLWERRGVAIRVDSCSLVVEKTRLGACVGVERLSNWVMQSSLAHRIVTLANGTRSVHSRDHSETFHPVIGPVAEAEALYVRQLKLPERVAAAQDEFVIWDVGLGPRRMC